MLVKQVSMQAHGVLFSLILGIRVLSEEKPCPVIVTLYAWPVFPKMCYRGPAPQLTMSLQEAMLRSPSPLGNGLVCLTSWAVEKVKTKNKRTQLSFLPCSIWTLSNSYYIGMVWSVISPDSRIFFGHPDFLVKILKVHSRVLAILCEIWSCFSWTVDLYLAPLSTGEITGLFKSSNEM